MGEVLAVYSLEFQLVALHYGILLYRVGDPYRTGGHEVCSRSAHGARAQSRIDVHARSVLAAPVPDAPEAEGMVTCQQTKPPRGWVSLLHHPLKADAALNGRAFGRGTSPLLTLDAGNEVCSTFDVA